MDMMLLGETVRGISDSVSFYGYWMPAGGNNGVCAIETFLVSAANLFLIDFETKSSDQVDSAVTSIGNVTISSTTPQCYKFDFSNAKELVRYVVTPAGTAGTDQFMHFQFCQPLWAPN
jgi:hypothetical protein